MTADNSQNQNTSESDQYSTDHEQLADATDRHRPPRIDQSRRTVLKGIAAGSALGATSIAATSTAGATTSVRLDRTNWEADAYYANKWKSGNVLDGDSSTAWDAGDSEGWHRMRVDMQATFTINKVEFPAPADKNRPLAVVKVSTAVDPGDDSSKWTEVARADSKTSSVTFSDTEARHVKVRDDGTDGVFKISELYVSGPEQPPTAPTGIDSPEKTSSTVKLTWEPAYGGTASVDHYNVYVDGSKQTELTDTSTTLTDLSANTTYNFRVSAVDADGRESSKSSQLSITTRSPDSESPSKPADLSVTGNPDYLWLDWTASSDNRSIDHYEVTTTGGETDKTAETTETSYAVPDLMTGTEYSVQVVALDPEGNRSDPATATASTMTGGFYEIDRSGWTASASDWIEDGEHGWTEGAHPPAHAIDGDLGTGMIMDSASGWFQIDMGASNQVYKLRSENGDFPDGNDSRVAGSIAVKESSDGETWSDVSVGSSNLGTTTTATFNANSQYIRMVDNGSSDWLDIAEFYLYGFDSEPPTAPGTLSASNVTRYSVDLSWDSASDAKSGVSHYAVYATNTLEENPEAEKIAEVEAGTTSATVDGLLAGTDYDIEITAVDNASLESDPSNTVSVTTSGKAFEYRGPPRYESTGMAQYGDWTHSLIGAGGKMTGIFTCPTNSNVVYARSDVSCVYRSDHGGDFWYGIHDGMASRGFSVDPRDENNVVLVKTDGIYHCPNVGKDYQNDGVSQEDIWSQPVSGAGSVNVQGLFPGANTSYRERGEIIDRSPTNPDILVTGGQSTGDEACVYRSTDNGQSWSLVESGPRNLHTVQVSYDPHNEGHVYLISRQNARDFNGDDFTAGIWKSTDHGQSWNQIFSGSAPPIEIAFDPDNEGVVYGYFGGKTGNNGSTVKKSVDSGQTWSEFMTGLPSSGETYGGIYADDGSIYLTSRHAFRSPSNDDFTENHGAIYQLPAGGSTWSVYFRGDETNPDQVDKQEWDDLWAPSGAISTDDIGGLAFDPNNPDKWYMAATYANYASTTAGKSWYYSSYGIEEMVGLDIKQDPSSNKVHAGIADTGYFRLQNDGEKVDYHTTMGEEVKFGGGTAINQVSLSDTESDRIYSTDVHYATWSGSGPKGRIYYSDDNGTSWDVVDALEGTKYSKGEEPTGENVTVTPGPGDSSFVYETELPLSNGGQNWYWGAWWNTGPAATHTPVGLSVHPNDDDHVVLGLGGQDAVYETTDGGATWQKQSATLKTGGQSWGGTFNGNFWMGNSELELSGDGSMVASIEINGPPQYYDPDSQTWNVIDLGRTGNTWHVARDAGIAGRYMLSLVDKQGGVYISEDGGKSWELLVGARSDSAEFDVNNENRIAVALADEDYPIISVDGGDTFVKLDELISGGGDHLTFAGDNLVMGSGGSSYLFSDISELETQTDAPATPTNLSIDSVGASEATLSWDAPDYAGSVGYYIYVDGDLDRRAWEPDATITGLSGSSSYDVTVSAASPTGSESGKTTAVTVETLDGQAPSVPANLTVSGYTHDSVSLSWDASTDNDTGIDQYTVYVDGTEKMQTSDSSAKVSGLMQGTTYDFAVAAVDGAGNESGTTPSLRQKTAHYVVMDAESTIDPSSSETTPVSVIQTSGFDPAAQIDTATVRFGSMDAVTNDSAAAPQSFEETDVDYDGDMDLSMEFVQSETGFESGDTKAVLTGKTTDGTKIAGADQIEVGSADGGEGDDGDDGEDDDGASGDPVVTLGSTSVPEGKGSAVELALSSAPNGLSGFDLTVSVDSPSVATITGASVSRALSSGTSEITTASDGSSVQIELADLGDVVQPNASEVSLASIELSGNAVGDATLSTTLTQIDDDAGSEIDATTQSGSITVTAWPPMVDDDVAGTPTDPDGDGLYEDVNGNGRIDFDDVVELNENKESDAVTENASAFDFNDNSEIDYDDIVELFDEI